MQLLPAVKDAAEYWQQEEQKTEAQYMAGIRASLEADLRRFFRDMEYPVLRLDRHKQFVLCYEDITLLARKESGTTWIYPILDDVIYEGVRSDAPFGKLAAQIVTPQPLGSWHGLTQIYQTPVGPALAWYEVKGYHHVSIKGLNELRVQGTVFTLVASHVYVVDGEADFAYLVEII